MMTSVHVQGEQLPTPAIFHFDTALQPFGSLRLSDDTTVQVNTTEDGAAYLEQLAEAATELAALMRGHLGTGPEPREVGA